MEAEKTMGKAKKYEQITGQLQIKGSAMKEAAWPVEASWDLELFWMESVLTLPPASWGPWAVEKGGGCPGRR